MPTISFSVDAETKKEIAKVAKREGKSQSDLFRELWGEFQFNKSWEYFQRLNRERTLKLGIQTDDDVERIFG